MNDALDDESGSSAAMQLQSKQHLFDHFKRLIEGNGTYQFLLLRETALDLSCVDSGDIDLLGSPQSVNSLLEFAFQLALQGTFHFRVVKRNPRKVALCLFSFDGAHRIELDLWIELWQIDRSARMLCYADCRSKIVAHTGAIFRLPIHLEACIYIHHLASKQRDLSTRGIRHRLKFYRQSLRNNGPTTLTSPLDELIGGGAISNDMLYLTAEMLESQLGATFKRSAGSVRASFLLTKLRAWMLGAPRRTNMIAIMGCDGVGKTSILRALVETSPQVQRLFTGKHLYRKSLIYKLMVALMRPLMRTPREKFDEQFALFAYFRASVALRLKFWYGSVFRRPGLTLIDRSLADFIYVNRKTDEPRFCKGYKISSFIGLRIPVIHLVVDHDILMERKLEFTRKGHEIYDVDMQTFLIDRNPTHYTVFNNSHGLEKSATALSNLIRH